MPAMAATSGPMSADEPAWPHSKIKTPAAGIVSCFELMIAMPCGCASAARALKTHKAPTMLRPTTAVKNVRVSGVWGTNSNRWAGGFTEVGWPAFPLLVNWPCLTMVFADVLCKKSDKDFTSLDAESTTFSLRW